MALQTPARLINYYLMRGTPHAFRTYPDYCNFLDDVSGKLGVQPNNLFMRGSCHLGYSIAPNPKVWTAMDIRPQPSDLDLVIVDVDYFNRINTEIQTWEQTNISACLQGKDYHYLDRQRDRLYNCCRDYDMPPVTCFHHKKTMMSIDVTKYCDKLRKLSAFIFRDWSSAHHRYNYDIRMLCQGIKKGELIAAPDEPIVVQLPMSASNAQDDGQQQSIPTVTGLPNTIS